MGLSKYGIVQKPIWNWPKGYMGPSKRVHGTIQKGETKAGEKIFNTGYLTTQPAKVGTMGLKRRGERCNDRAGTRECRQTGRHPTDTTPPQTSTRNESESWRQKSPWWKDRQGCERPARQRPRARERQPLPYVHDQRTRHDLRKRLRQRPRWKRRATTHWARQPRRTANREAGRPIARKQRSQRKERQSERWPRRSRSRRQRRQRIRRVAR